MNSFFKKTILLTAILVFTALLFSCAKPDVSQGDSVTDSDVSEPIIELLPFDEPMQLVFSSGAGGWATELLLQPDGSFEGHFFDGEMGVRDEEKYPYGTTYVCDFSGNFFNIIKISDTSYSLKIKKLECEKEEGAEWIEDGKRYVASIPYGLEGKDFIFYTPETPYSDLPEYVALWDYRYFADDERPENLGIYSLYAVESENAFFS